MSTNMTKFPTKVVCLDNVYAPEDRLTIGREYLATEQVDGGGFHFLRIAEDDLGYKDNLYFVERFRILGE